MFVIGPADGIWGLNVVPGVGLFEFLLVGATCWRLDCKRQTHKNLLEIIGTNKVKVYPHLL